MIIFSHLAQLRLSNARDSAFAFGKVLVYFFVLLGSINNLKRLRLFLVWLVCLIAVLAVLSLLQYYEFIDFNCLKSFQHRSVDEDSGEESIVVRLRSNGFFNDPNDFSLLLSTGIVVSLYWFFESTNRWCRVLLLATASTMGFAFLLTQTRGGFLALGAALLILFKSKYGLAKTMTLVSCVAFPMLLFSNRQANLDLADSNDTGQERIKLWQEGFELFREAPVFGIGHGEYSERVLLVAHNSFVHCFTELGIIGGTCFVGLFYCAITPLRRLSYPADDPDSLPKSRLRHCLLAMVVAYAVGLFSLSRAYVPPTYLILGLVAAFLAQEPEGRLSSIKSHLNAALLKNILATSVGLLFVIYLFIKVFAN
jgi:O-antigen ligase